MSEEITGAFTLTNSVRFPSRFSAAALLGSRFGSKFGATLTALYYVIAGFGLGAVSGALLGVIGQNVAAFAVNGAIMGLGIGAAVGLPAAIGQLNDD